MKIRKPKKTNEHDAARIIFKTLAKIKKGYRKNCILLNKEEKEYKTSKKSIERELQFRAVTGHLNDTKEVKQEGK